MNYPSIRIEGAILSPDILDRLEDLQGQRPADFGIPSPTKVKDEIARAWADAQDYWRIYLRKIESLGLNSLGTTETRNLWIVPLLGLLGYQLEYQHQGIKIGDKSYPLSHRTINRALAAVHITGYRDPAGLDRKPERAAGPRMSAHAMVQEYLNLSDQLYAIVTNGKLLRLLRDSSRLVKLTYLEFDLDRIFTDGLFADFAVLYRLLHATRLPVSPEAAPESLIERYHQDSVDSGARIRDGLSRAVEDAIVAFANGLLAHPANQSLRDSVQDGSLKPDALYQHLLRLIYRLLFLLVIEERNLVYPLSPSAAKRDLYYRYYSLQRLRRLAERRYLADPRHDDLWLALLACFRLFEDGGPGPKLGIAPLAGDLFGPDAIGPISGCRLDNRTVLQCLRSLSLYQHPDTNQIIRVSYAALNVEEFGSVYEGLLEYEPVFRTDGSHIAFVFAKGDERAATGSHYTPDDLVQPLLKHSLDYLIADKLKESDKEKALLSLRVADISCGSGHILLAAARRIATELAIVRTGEEQPSPAAFRAAIRDVIRQCIYGVDLNPLAVELCKVALWLEAHSPGEPLNFLDHHIKCGNAIVGFAHREEMEQGVPDEAFVTMPGDDRVVAAALRKKNKEERKYVNQLAIRFPEELEAHLESIRSAYDSFYKLPQRTPSEVEAAKKAYDAISTGPHTALMRQIAAIPISQFYLPKTPDNLPRAITDEQFRRYWKGEQTPQGQATATAWTTANRKRFFHWFLEFPDIIAHGGFDCILGNPPYLGGNRIANRYGIAVAEFLKYSYRIDGNSDLVVYFLNRAFSILSHVGCMGMIASQSIKDGTSRLDGLKRFVQAGCNLLFAKTNQRWPGRAATNVDLVTISKMHVIAPRVLNDKVVDAINSQLQPGSEDVEPQPLASASNCSYVGVALHGDGFILSTESAEQLLRTTPSTCEYVKPYLIGDDLNSSPTVSATRYVIDFFGLDEHQASAHESLFSIVREKVYPERQHNNRPVRKKHWWLFGENSAGLRTAVRGISRCLVAAKTSKHLNFIFIQGNIVFDQSLTVLPQSDDAYFAIVQSTLHEVWARKTSSNQGGTPRYNGSTALATFPFPPVTQDLHRLLVSSGSRYHEHRRALMLQLWLGLTDIYNLFHDRDLTPEVVAQVSKKPADADAGYQGILQLRTLHRELDEAILAAYGWSGAVPLGHDFHEIETLPENDRVRYTINPAARKEVLKRILALNHARAEAEAASAPAVAKPKRDRKATVATTEVAADIDLFVAMSYPASETDKAICAAAVAAVEQSAGLNSMDHLDALLLATHPAWCKVFLPAADQKRVDTAVAKAPAALFVSDNDSIRWKDARDHLEQRKALKVDHAGTAQPISAGADLAAVKASLPVGVDEVVALALKALDRVRNLRQQSVAATQEQQRILSVFRREAQSCGLAVA